MRYVSDAALEGYVKEGTVREALRRVRQYVEGLPRLQGRSFERGYMKAYGLFAVGKPPGERPFDFAVNKSSLKCYIRKPGLVALGPVRQQRVLSSFAAAAVLNGELRVDITDSAEAEMLLACLFE